MKIQIERPFVEALTAAYPELHALADQLKLGPRAEVPFHQLSAEQLGFLSARHAEAVPALQGRAAQLATLAQALNDPGPRLGEGEGELEALVPAIAAFLLRDAIRGWLFRANAAGRPLPWLVVRIDYTPPGENEAGRVLLDLKANSMARIATASLVFRERDIVGRTMAEIFAAAGYLKETPELIAAYDRSAAEIGDRPKPSDKGVAHSTDRQQMRPRKQ